MKITNLTSQVRNPDRVNVYIDGKYLFSLDISQIVDFKVKVGQEIDQPTLDFYKTESEFGKLYSRALEYSLTRPHSKQELKNYLFKKTLSTIDKKGKKIEGYSKSVSDRVFERLIEKGYLDDYKFAQYWIENRNLRKGISSRKLIFELKSKGINSNIINELLDEFRDDKDEIQKIIIKKQNKYDHEKMFAYLIRQGFSYDDVKQALKEY